MFNRRQKKIVIGFVLLILLVMGTPAISFSFVLLQSHQSVTPQTRKDIVAEYLQSKQKRLIVVAANRSAPSRDLPFVETDAKEIANTLRGLGYRQDAYLYNKTATRNKFIDALNKIDKTQRDASLIIYFTGHAVSDSQQKDLWLQLYGQTEIAPYLGISVGEIIGIVRGEVGYSGELSIIIDSCSSGLATLSKSLNLGELGEKTTIITSSSPTQVSVSVDISETKRMSAFTYCLIKALTDGWQDADGDRDGLMKYTELSDYTENVLAKLFQGGKINEEMEPGILTNKSKMIIGIDPEKVFNWESQLRILIASQMLRLELAIKQPSIVPFPNRPVSVQPPTVSPRAKEIADEISENADSVTKAMKALAQGDYDGARRLLIDAESFRENSLAEIYQAHGRVEIYTGAFKSASEWYQRLLDLKPQDDPEGLRNEAEFLLEAGIVFVVTGDFGRSEPLLRKSLAILNSINPATEEIAAGKFMLGFSSHINGRISEAESLLKEALSIIESVPDEDSISHTLILGALVGVYIDQGKNKEAEIFVTKLRRLTEDSKKSNKIEAYLWGTLFFVGTLVKKEKYSEAKSILQESTLVLENAEQRNEIPITTFHAPYGMGYLSLEEYQKAETYLLSGISSIEKVLGADNWLLNYYYRGLAKAYKERKALAESERCLKKAISLLEKASPPDDLVDTLVELADLYEEQAMLNEAESLYKRALSIETEGKGIFGCGYVAKYSLGNIYHRQKKYAEAEKLFREGKACELKLRKPDDPGPIRGLDYLANTLKEQGRLEEVETLYREAEALYKGVISIQQKTYGQFHPQIAEAYYNLGIVYESSEKAKEAEEAFRQAILVDEKSRDPKHTEFPTYVYRLAWFYFNQERYADAEKLYKRVVMIRSQALGVWDTEVARLLCNLGATYKKEGKYKQAEATLKQALEILERAGDSSSVHFANTMSWLGALYLSTNKFNDAESYFSKAIQIYEKPWDSEGPALAFQITFLAKIYMGQGKLGEAEASFIRARKIFEKSPWANTIEVAQCLTGLAQLYEKQGRFDDAEQLYKHTLTILEAKPNQKDDSLVECLNAYKQLLRKMNRLAEATELDNRIKMLRKQRKMKKNSE